MLPNFLLLVLFIHLLRPILPSNPDQTDRIKEVIDHDFKSLLIYTDNRLSKQKFGTPMQDAFLAVLID